MTTTPDVCLIPVQPCAPWCISTEDAHRQEHPNDRECCSEFHSVPLTLHRAVDWGARGDRWGYDKLDVLMRRSQAGEHEVLLSHEAGCERCERDHEVRLTLDETRRLYSLLRDLVNQAESA